MTTILVTIPIWSWWVPCHAQHDNSSHLHPPLAAWWCITGHLVTWWPPVPPVSGMTMIASDMVTTSIVIHRLEMHQNTLCTPAEMFTPTMTPVGIPTNDRHIPVGTPTPTIMSTYPQWVWVWVSSQIPMGTPTLLPNNAQLMSSLEDLVWQATSSLHSQ